MKLHLISLDVPFPPDYGGMVDVFYKIRNLHAAGVRIYLHCFEFGRGEQHELEAYCEAVFYYKRKTGLRGLSLSLPYMMYSRRDKQLLHNLAKIDAPILFEGVHTTYYLAHPLLDKHFKLLRNQNLEQDYYTQLANREPGFLKKLYYRIEARLLRNLENNLQKADVFLTVAEHDHLFFKKVYPNKVHEYIPSFQPYDSVTARPGLGDYVLYHGNLGHPENIEAALFLLEQVCPKTDIPFIFAGKSPDEKVKAVCASLPNCRLIANPDVTAMEQLIANAQLHVLPTFQATGLKLKLLHALFNGRHVIVNEAMVLGTGLSEVCHLAGTPGSFLEKIKELMTVPFNEVMIESRNNLLMQRYDNRRNAERIKAYLLQP